jgi:hypothetical protein
MRLNVDSAGKMPKLAENIDKGEFVMSDDSSAVIRETRRDWMTEHREM